METEKIFYVYVDFRGDDEKPFYVGKGLEKRVKKERRNPLHTNIKNKHGIIREVVFETHNEQEAFVKEIQLIGELQTHIDHGNGGANLTLGGEGSSGYKFTEEHREKRSELNKKMWEDPEFRAMMKEKMRLGREDPEYREKMHELSKKMWEDPERREKVSKSMKKALEDPEHRKKMSELSKKMWEDPEVRKKQGEKMREVLGDPEIREKISKITKEKLSDPEIRKKMSESRKKYLEKLTPEQRSERVRLSWETRRLKKLQQEVLT